MGKAKIDYDDAVVVVVDAAVVVVATLSKSEAICKWFSKMSARGRSMIIKGLLAGEVVFLIGSYRVWHQMNTNQDYRLWMQKNYPSVLAGFYKSGEMIGITDTRENDFKAWGIEA